MNFFAFVILLFHGMCVMENNAAHIPVDTKFQGDNVIEDIISEALEEFRKIMRTGDPDIGIPVLAPYEAEVYITDFGIGSLLQ